VALPHAEIKHALVDVATGSGVNPLARLGHDLGIGLYDMRASVGGDSGLRTGGGMHDR